MAAPGNNSSNQGHQQPNLTQSKTTVTTTASQGSVPESIKQFVNTPSSRDPYYAPVRIPERREHVLGIRDEIGELEKKVNSGS